MSAVGDIPHENPQHKLLHPTVRLCYGKKELSWKNRYGMMLDISLQASTLNQANFPVRDTREMISNSEARQGSQATNNCNCSKLLWQTCSSRKKSACFNLSIIFQLLKLTPSHTYIFTFGLTCRLIGSNQRTKFLVANQY